MTTSLDNRFKVWLLVEGEEGEGEEEGGREGKRRRKVSLWTCRSVSSYRGLPCMDAAFSQDGSLLAVNWSKVRALNSQYYSLCNGDVARQNVTVWDPYSCELRQTFSTPHKDEVFK